MTFEELSEMLPNGFHDAEIRMIRVDFVDRFMLLGVNIHVSTPGDSDRERYRQGTLKVESLCLFFVEPPDHQHRFVLDGAPLNATGNTARAGQNAKVDRLLTALPPNSTAYLFFLDDWNSRLYLAGAGVEFSWDDGGAFV